jgi:uncharacterized repeat protein (TIGR01451 family)
MVSTRSTAAGRAGRFLIFVSTMGLMLGLVALPARAAFADVVVDKEAVAATITAGDTAAFTLTVTNVGNLAASTVALSDTLPDSGLVWSENPDAAQCSISGGVLTCAVATLAAGASFSVTVEAETNPELCDYTITNTATVSARNEPVEKKNSTDSASIAVECEPTGEGCTRTIGFWKTHYPDDWPADVLANGLTLGTVTYTAAQLEDIFNEPPAGNGLIILAHQLIGAKINVASGADATGIQSSINAADALIDGLVVPPVGSGFLAPGDTESLVTALTDYNEGTTGPGHCDEE